MSKSAQWTCTEGTEDSIDDIAERMPFPRSHFMKQPVVDELSHFIQCFIPIKEADVAFAYHTPRHWSFSPSTCVVRKIIFSITPTKSVYTSLYEDERKWDGDRSCQNLVNVAFLHRPFDLERYKIPRRYGVVLASHKSFDELLTTGWNVQLAAKLGVVPSTIACIQGYKGDLGRRIGLVGRIASNEGQIMNAIWSEFGAWEGTFGFSREHKNGVLSPKLVDDCISSESRHEKITTVAIMNAFHPEEVDRVAQLAYDAGLVSDPEQCSELVYLTGAVRPPGLEAALAKGMKVVCVGHKTCEDWGIRFLAAMTQRQWPDIEVVVIDEPEESRVRAPTPKPKQDGN